MQINRRTVLVRQVVLFVIKRGSAKIEVDLTKCDNCGVGALFDAVKHASLHALLDLATTNHNVKDFCHTPLRIVLPRQIRSDTLLAHLRANQEASFDLTLDAIQVLLIRGRFKALDAG